MAKTGPSYPHRFLAAAAYAGLGLHAPPSSPLPRFSDESAVILYALYQQATVGPCKVPKPRTKNSFEQERWNSWSALANMPSIEAMRLFVKILEEEDPAWLSKVQDVEPPEVKEEPWSLNGPNLFSSASSPTSAEVKVFQNGTPIETEDKDVLIQGIAAVSVQDKWVSVQVSGRKPSPRYQHASAIIGNKMYIVGGNHNGRYLNDVQILDLNTLTWSKVEQKPESENPVTLSPCAGHSLIKWDNRLLVIAGHSKIQSDTVAVHEFNTDTNSWSVVKTYGSAPVARGGQSITLVGSNLVMFGGEDSKRRLLNDLNILDLETMTWDSIETIGTPPSPRSDHSATVQSGRYLLIFGGGSHSTCFNDLHVLDLDSMEWSQPKPLGVLPTPRAGHAAIAIEDNWYIIGGGDNKTGVSKTMILNMSTFEWSVAASIEGQVSVASEGLSVVSTTSNGELILIAFGGYNGRYINEVYVMMTKSQTNDSLSVLSTSLTDNQLPSRGLSNGQDQENRVKEIVMDIPKSNNNAIGGENLTANGDLAAAVSTLQAENAQLKHILGEAQATNSELSMELHSVRAQLDDEQSRCFRLEVDLAELRQKLQNMEALQKELELLRRQKAAADKVAASVAPQQPGGVWGWLAGSPTAKVVET